MRWTFPYLLPHSFIYASKKLCLKALFSERCVNFTPQQEFTRVEWQRSERGKKIGDPMTNTGKVTEELMKWQYLWKERGSSSNRDDVCWNEWNQSAEPVYEAGPVPKRQHQTVCFSLFAVLPPMENTEP